MLPIIERDAGVRPTKRPKSQASIKPAAGKPADVYAWRREWAEWPNKILFSMRELYSNKCKALEEELKERRISRRTKHGMWYTRTEFLREMAQESSTNKMLDAQVCMHGCSQVFDACGRGGGLLIGRNESLRRAASHRRNSC